MIHPSGCGARDGIGGRAHVRLLAARSRDEIEKAAELQQRLDIVLERAIGDARLGRIGDGAAYLGDQRSEPVDAIRRAGAEDTASITSPATPALAGVLDEAQRQAKDARRQEGSNRRAAEELHRAEETELEDRRKRDCWTISASTSIGSR